MASRGWTGSEARYPGERLGLPRSGPGALASFGRRLLAFGVDAVLSDLVAWALFQGIAYWNLVVFFAEVYLLTALIGRSAGQLLCGVYVARLDNRPVGFLWALVRTVLLCLLIPALIWDRDFRGLHDKAAHTAVCRV